MKKKQQFIIVLYKSIFAIHVDFDKTHLTDPGEISQLARNFVL